MVALWRSEYGAPEVPVIGRNEDSALPLSNVGWNRVSKPLAPLARGFFVGSGKEAGDYD